MRRHSVDEDPPPPEPISILLRDWDQRRTEITTLLERYSRQERAVILYLTVIAVVTLSLLTIDVKAGKVYIPAVGQIALSTPLHEHFQALVLVVLSTGVLLALYFISALMELLRWIQAVSARAAAVETEVNRRSGERILTWDSLIVPTLISPPFLFDPPFVAPAILLGLWAMAIFLGSIALLTFVCYILAYRLFWVWCPLVWLLCLYHVSCWIWLVTKHRSDVDSLVLEMTRPSESEAVKHPASCLGLLGSGVLPKLTGIFPSKGSLIVAGSTLSLGFVPFLVMSISSGSFWPDSHVSLPLLLVPSVVLGDSLLLPVFNANVFFLAVPLLQRESTTRTRLIWLVVMCLLISAPIIVYQHLLWTEDQVTGFVKLVPNRLSAAGIWHAAFASAQTAIAVWFLVVSLLYANSPFRIPRTHLLRTWGVFVLYSSLCALDFIVKQYRLSFVPVRLTDLIALSPIVLATAAYLVIRRIAKGERATRVEPGRA